MGYAEFGGATLGAASGAVGSISALQVGSRTDTPQAIAKAIVDGASKGKAHDVVAIDAKTATITAKDAARGADVRKAVEALLSPTEVGELRRAADHREMVAAGKPEILTLRDGTKTDGFGVRLSGNEPKYEPNKWNLGAGTAEQEYNNCYAYAVNDLSPTRTSKPQPGERAGATIDYFPGGKIDVGKLKDAIAADGKTTGIKWLGDQPSDTLKAPKGSYIVALVVDTRDSVQDYHWYRHNPDGTWSGKGGASDATDKDGAGQTILDPRTANRFVGSFRAGNLDYNKFVGYYAVTPGAQVGVKP